MSRIQLDVKAAVSSFLWFFAIAVAVCLIIFSGIEFIMFMSDLLGSNVTYVNAFGISVIVFCAAAISIIPNVHIKGRNRDV